MIIVVLFHRNGSDRASKDQNHFDCSNYEQMKIGYNMILL
jgi:hypothetical protein